jgi:glycosyltransferase involved in cell wall biosynthesis
MKVLMIVIGFSSLGGLEIVGRDVARALVAGGHAVTVWSALDSADPLDGVCIEELAPASRLARSAHYRLLKRKLALRVKRHRDGYDLVICMHPRLAPGIHRGLRASECPFWVWGHGTDVWGAWSPALGRALAGAQRMVAVSNFTASLIRAKMPETDVLVIPPTVDIHRFSADTTPPDLSRDPTLLTVSRIAEDDAYKGHDRVIQALPLIEQVLGRHVRYRIVGSGNGADRLRGLAREHGVLDRVTLLGRVDDRTLADEYRRCDLFVMPSRMEPAPGGSFLGEGFGIVYIEAQSTGRPVVASKQGGAPETLQEGVTGLTADPDSPRAIAAACARILSLPDRGRSMGSAGRAFVARTFARDVFQERLNALLAGR